MIKPTLKNSLIRPCTRTKEIWPHRTGGFNKRHPWHLKTYEGTEVRIDWNPIGSLLDEIDERKRSDHADWMSDPDYRKYRYDILTKPAVYIGTKDHSDSN